VEEISRFFDISADHVTKVMQHLARQGYIRSRRGRNGGAVLARAPEQIRLGNILRDFEQITLLDCLNNEEVCLIETDCRLKKILSEGQKRMMAYFDGVSLRDLTRRSRSQEKMTRAKSGVA
jgi:Rrf2 family nitric oxide-sensitive transcriptional repressor